MLGPRFTDCHTHMLPSGDDGVDTIEEATTLCERAAERGTSVLFATPHVWPHLTLTEDREQAIREAFAELRPQVDIDLRLGFELTPTDALLDEDPRRYALEGVDAVLMEVPFDDRLDVLIALAERTERAGLRPVIAHPERGEAVLEHPELALDLARRGWLLQINATSVLGAHGPGPERVAWRLVEDGAASLVASDGHRATRPPFLDAAFAAVRQRIGWEPAVRLFDGSALLGATPESSSSRAASTGA